MEPADKSAQKKKMLGMVFGIIAFGIASFAVQTLFFKAPTFDKAMMKAASELNKTCPIMVDSDTRLDNAVAMPNNTFQYNYTLVNLEKGEVNIDTVRKYIEPSIVNNVRTNPQLKSFRDNKVTMNYNYRDKNGEFVMEMKVTPDMYSGNDEN
jgi:hypothetical protein